MQRETLSTPHPLLSSLSPCPRSPLLCLLYLSPVAPPPPLLPSSIPLPPLSLLPWLARMESCRPRRARERCGPEAVESCPPSRCCPPSLTPTPVCTFASPLPSFSALIYCFSLLLVVFTPRVVFFAFARCVPSPRCSSRFVLSCACCLFGANRVALRFCNDTYSATRNTFNETHADSIMDLATSIAIEFFSFDQFEAASASRAAASTRTRSEQAQLRGIVGPSVLLRGFVAAHANVFSADLRSMPAAALMIRASRPPRIHAARLLRFKL